MNEADQNTAIEDHLGIERQFHLLKGGYYYRENSCGYTSQLTEAGLYSKEEAESSLRGCDELQMVEVRKTNYCNDLNAMHEAIMSLGIPQRSDFCVTLNKVMGLEQNICGWQLLINATAAQRAEAFLRTLNLWTD